MVYMSLSPDGTKLAALHLSGALSLWQVPSLRHKRTWMQDEQVLLKGAPSHKLFKFVMNNPKFCNLLLLGNDMFVEFIDLPHLVE